MMKTNTQVQGFTFLEVVVTMAITSIGLMGLISLQMQALQGTNDAGNRSQAIFLVNDIANRIRANHVAADSYVTPIGGVDCEDEITKKCTDFHGGSAADCSGAELAAWDKFEVACRTSNIISHPVQYLPGANLKISILNSTKLFVELTWKSRSDNEGITGAERTENSGQLTHSVEVSR